ncbi:MAG: hypothetical protein FJY77_05550, partial [Candidatus Altiarchaeales archaeon]|nr:hypothetical protein [Candidatus Altiarchaeales archaeon]
MSKIETVGGPESPEKRLEALVQAALENKEGKTPKDWFMAQLRKCGWDRDLAGIFGTLERGHYLDAAGQWWDRVDAEAIARRKFDVPPMEIDAAVDHLTKEGLSRKWAKRVLSYRDVGFKFQPVTFRPVIIEQLLEAISCGAVPDLETRDAAVLRQLLKTSERELSKLGLTSDDLIFGLTMEFMASTSDIGGNKLSENYPLTPDMPGDMAQRHMNSIFYSKGSEILLKCIDTSANLDPKIGEALAEDFCARIERVCGANMPQNLVVVEQGIGDAFLAASFLDRVKDKHLEIYKRLTYVLTDSSKKMLNDSKTNYFLWDHIQNRKIQWIHADATERLSLPEKSVDLFISYELVDDLPTKEVWKRESGYAETRINLFYSRGFEPPTLSDGRPASMADFAKAYQQGPEALSQYVFNPRAVSYSFRQKPTDLAGIPYRDVVMSHLSSLPAGTKVPINIGGMRHLDHNLSLLNPETQAEYKLCDYGTESTEAYTHWVSQCFFPPFFSLGHITSKVNNTLLMAFVADKARREHISFETALEWQGTFVSQALGERFISVQDIIDLKANTPGRYGPSGDDFQSRHLMAVLNTAYPDHPPTRTFVRQRSWELQRTGMDISEIRRKIEDELKSPGVRE